MNQLRLICLLTLLFNATTSVSQELAKGALLYTNPMATKADMNGWRIEGRGETVFENGWMRMFSPNKKGHHVYWCPQQMPANFIAEWEAQHVEDDAGLCIVFFAASGEKGQDIFDASLPLRDGTFTQYTKGKINTYHISYYANGKDDPGRLTANLRKNKGFHLVQTGQAGIPIHSLEVHRIKLVKWNGRIELFVDERKVIDWVDDGLALGKILEGGRIGFRQMKWTNFAYRNFSVWECLKE